MNEHIYTEWTSDNPQSFGGIYRSYEKYRDLNKKQIEDSFQRNDIYTRFRQFKKAKIHNPVIVYKKRDQFQADVCSSIEKSLFRVQTDTNICLFLSMCGVNILGFIP